VEEKKQDALSNKQKDGESIHNVLWEKQAQQNSWFNVELLPQENKENGVMKYEEVKKVRSLESTKYFLAQRRSQENVVTKNTP